MRATNTGCATANAVGQGIVDGFARLSEEDPNRVRFPLHVKTWSNPREESGRELTWRCRYELQPASMDAAGDWLPPYEEATCRRLGSRVEIAMYS